MYAPPIYGFYEFCIRPRLLSVCAPPVYGFYEICIRPRLLSMCAPPIYGFYEICIRLTILTIPRRVMMAATKNRYDVFQPTPARLYVLMCFCILYYSIWMSVGVLVHTFPIEISIYNWEK